MRASNRWVKPPGVHSPLEATREEMMPPTVRSAAPIPIVRIAPAAGLGRTDLFPSRPRGTAEQVRGESIGKERQLGQDRRKVI
jgi:hypothetical protein